jgi:hypothetical protein
MLAYAGMTSERSFSRTRESRTIQTIANRSRYARLLWCDLPCVAGLVPYSLLTSWRLKMR